MDTSLFWTHKDYFEKADKGHGFSLFSIGHLAWLVGIAIGIAILAIVYRRLNQRQRDNMRKAMAVGLILLEALKICVMGLTHVDTADYLPLHLCSAAGLFIVIDALWPNTRLIPQLFLFAFTAGAMMALICSSATSYPFWNFYSIHIFFFHGYILAYPIMRLTAGEFKPSYSGVWISIAAMVVIGLPIYAIDGVFDVNYMFLGRPSDISLLISIWDITAPIGGRFLYAVTIGALGAAIAHLLYLFYRLPDIFRCFIRLFKRAKRKIEKSV